MLPSRRLLPSIAALRALEALDRLGSAKAVAAELNQTQSAISRQLRSLEDGLNRSLFIRKSKRLFLTPQAQAYAAQVRQALDQIARASMKLHADTGGGTLDLAILPTFGMRWLVPRLADFARLHPEVSVNLSTRMEKVNFAREPFDAAIHFGYGAWPGTEAILLKPELVWAVCAPDLLRARSLARCEDVLALPLLHIASRPEAWRDWFAAQGVQGARITGTVHDQFATILQAALHGLGVALLPDYLAQPDVMAGRLVPVWGAPVPGRGAYYLVSPTEKTSDPALARFRDWIAGHAELEEDPLPR